MALTPVNKIYSPELTDTPLARTQMRAMASSVEYAINSLRESLNAPLENVLARIVELESRPGGAGGGGGATIISITTEGNDLVFKMSDGRVLRTSMATNPDGDLSLYVERVEAAQVAADSARAALQDLTSDLGAAKGAVAAVANRIGAVESAISDVDARATQVAGAAADTSSEAKDALTRAGNAEVKALEAASIASGKGKMIHSATPPTGEDAAITNLWIRASDSKAHRWDGVKWVAITDKAITDAAQSAGAAQAAAADAHAAAAAADSKAVAAKNAADSAQATATRAASDAAAAATAASAADAKALQAAGVADGKGRVIYSTAAPAAADRLTQNLWIKLPENIPHRWSGSAWVAVTDKAATDAAAAAVSAQAKADKAERDAAAAQATADQAKRDAAAAQAAAVTADGKASQAISAAQAAQGTADKAVSDAAAAQAAASAADRKALDAAGLAGSKGKVIYSATAPTGADQVGQNLWIRTTDNRPHRWSGSAWVAVTDKVATDAAASAAAANTLASQAKAAADKAQADATSAATAAQDAMRAANQAQDSANGKNTVSYTTGTPAGVGTRIGDTHYQVNAAGTVLRWWRWSGTAWVEQALDGRVISSLDAGKITAGTLDAARIKAGSITADKMLIGIGDNLVPNGNGGAAEGWEAFNREPSPAESNGNPGSFWVQGRKVPRTSRFPIRPGVYRFSVDARTSVPAGARFYVQLAFFRAGVQLTVPYPVSDQVLYPEYRTYTGQVTAPAGTDSYEIRVYSMHSRGTVDEAEKCWYTGFELREIRDGSLIVNGSITGEKVNAESVAAAVGTFVKVNAENVAVTGELAARVVTAMTTQTKNLVVTESAILQHTTLLGTTVAERLNVTKKLVARDAIVDGTLDVAQLNVTEQMAASIVNAMSVNAKKLVVTESAILQHSTLLGDTVAEHLNVTKKLVARDAIVDGTLDVGQLNVTSAMSAEIVSAMSVESKKLVVSDEAILNKATVVQSLVTPELVARKINSALITGSVIQTDTQSNAGVKIDSNGYKAYDGNGNLAVDLNGKDNLIVGTLRTGYLNKPGVVIPQNYTNIAGLEQLGVWLTRDGRAPGTSEASKWGFTSGLWMDQAGTDSNSVLPLNIRGQNGGGTRIWGGLALGNANNDAYISPVGTGSMTIRSRGFAALNVDKGIDISSFDVLNLSGTAGVVIKTNGNLAIRDSSGNAYSSTYSGGGLLNMVLGSASGRVYVQSSSERFKTEVVTMEPDDTWLDVRTVWYRDKESVRVRDMVLAREASGDNTPRSAYEAERIADAGKLTAGRIAEEAHEAGLTQTIYEADGVTPLSYDYARDGVMLIPHVRSHRDRITALEEEVATLKQLLEGAKK